jgi:hypothetical protein
VTILSKLMGNFLNDLARLAEAEGRQLKRGAMEFLLGALVLLAGLVMLVGGLGLILFGLYAVLVPTAGPGGSAFIAGGVALLLAVCLTSLARWMAK